MAEPDNVDQPAPERPGTRPFKFGEGRISGYLSALFGISALLGVLCFIFPEWLTTSEFRESLYTFEFARNLLWLGIVIAFTMGIVSYILSPQKRLSATGIGTAFIAVLLGAFNVQERAVQEVPFSFGVDWFVLSLVFSMAIFIPLEKAFARHPLAVLRPEWRTDLTYFCISHLLIQFFLLFTNIVQTDVLGWAHSASVTAFAQGLPVWIQFLACVFIADFFQAVTHRWYHQVPWLWKFHSIHHSSKNMDWLAGSRTHFIEALATRTAVIVPLYIINFSEPALNAYVVLVGVQAVRARERALGFRLPEVRPGHAAVSPLAPFRRSGIREHELRGPPAADRHADGNVQAAGQDVAGHLRRFRQAAPQGLPATAGLPVQESDVDPPRTCTITGSRRSSHRATSTTAFSATACRRRTSPLPRRLNLPGSPSAVSRQARGPEVWNRRA